MNFITCPTYTPISWQNQEYTNFIFFSSFGALKGDLTWGIAEKTGSNNFDNDIKDISQIGDIGMLAFIIKPTKNTLCLKTKMPIRGIK